MNIQEIKEQVKEVISYSQDIENPNVDELIDKWLCAKQDIIQSFGGKCIVESEEPVVFHLSPKAKQNKVLNFIDSLSWYGKKNLDLCDFIYSNAVSFFDNTVESDYIYKTTKIPKGMKIVKAFKYFESDKETLYKIQSEASQIIQEDKVEGKLCFSVHPLDFLSSSENTYNWRSCHALDGEYRAGNLSYMLDRATVICYIKGADNVELPMFGNVPWNSKKWRVLLFLSEARDMIAVGRQYPFALSTGIEEIKNKFLNIIEDKSAPLFSRLEDSVVDSIGPSVYITPHINIRGKLMPKEEIIIDESELHFNDLLRSNSYKMLYSTRKFQKSIPLIRVGSKVKCLCCGKNYLDNPESMMCLDCDLKYGNEENDIFGICSCCGARYIRDEGYYIESHDEEICPHCAEHQCSYCESCGELFYSDELVYDEDMEDYVCEECYNNRRMENKRY